MKYIRGDRVREVLTGAIGEIRKAFKAGNCEVWLETTRQTKILWDNEIEPISKIWIQDEYADVQSHLMSEMSTAAGLNDNGFKQTKFRPCSHWRDPFELDNGLYVYASGKLSKGKVDEAPVPTAGVYLDQSWMANFGTLWTTSAMPSHIQDKMADILAIRWPDRGVIPVWDLSVGVVWALERVRNGDIVEVACLGSHGRTGTFLAALLVYLGRSADEAIKQVKGDHCSRAIETKGQENLIVKLHKSVNEKKEIK